MSDTKGVGGSDAIKASNWKGSIPVVLTLAPTSLSSPTLPPPLHCLLSRHTFLHIGLESAVRRLHKFAPPTFSFQGGGLVVQEPEVGSNASDDEDGDDRENETTKDNEEDTKDKDSSNTTEKSISLSPITDPYPVCWFEDVDTELPLPYLFAGVLWDSKPDSQRSLPWKLRLHFRNYPTSQILELPEGEVEATLERLYKNSLKQALFLQHSNAKVAMNMTKQTHEQLWDAIRQSKYPLYRQATSELHPSDSNPPLLPVRLVVDAAKPVIQRRWTLTKKKSVDEVSKNDTTTGDKDTEPKLSTLGDLLLAWAPEYFQFSSLSDKEDGDPTSQSLSIDASRQWRVAGIQAPLETPLVDLWKHLCHPDHFLYIVLTTKSTSVSK